MLDIDKIHIATVGKVNEEIKEEDLLPWGKLSSGVAHYGVVLRGWDPSKKLHSSMSRADKKVVKKKFKEGKLFFERPSSQCKLLSNYTYHTVFN